MESNNQQKELKVVKNILLIGRTGSGKSTLANVLINKGDNFEEVFKESAGSISETKNFKTEEAEIDGKTYRVIDTVGFGDTTLEVTKIPPVFKEMDKHTSEGVDYVFFTFKGKFTSEDIKTFEYLKEIFFDEEVVNYTALIRTNFKDFRKEDKCEEDREKLKSENKAIAEIVNKVKIIYVNNALPIDDEDEHSIATAKKAKSVSRQKLLEHLGSCQNEKSCKPRIGDLGERIKRMNEKELNELREKNERIDRELKNMNNFIN